jgi:hypothetical protein
MREEPTPEVGGQREDRVLAFRHKNAYMEVGPPYKRATLLQVPSVMCFVNFTLLLALSQFFSFLQISFSSTLFFVVVFELSSISTSNLVCVYYTSKPV